MDDQNALQDEVDLEATAAVGEAVTGASSAGRKWILGAYALLVLWGVAYLLLFFSDRLPG